MKTYDSQLRLSTSTSAGGGSFDTVVIGSGFGGAAVACRLAQAGQKVAVLERGPELPLGQGKWKTTGHGTRRSRHGHFLIDEGDGMNVIRGIGLGGGSLHYFGVRLRTHPHIFESNRWPQEITRRVLDPYYDISEAMLGARPIAPNPVAGMPFRGEKFIAAAKACRRSVGEPEWVPLAVHSGPEPKPTPAGVPETRCVYCGDCLIGCPSSETFEGDVNARELLTLNYLAVAKNHGAEMFTEHFVQEIRPWGEPEADGGFEIDFTVGDPEEPVADLGPVQTLYARRLVLGAGTLGSTELLLKSRANFPRLSRRLGQGFSGNGDFLYARAKGTPFDLQPKSGPLIVAGADFSNKDHKIYIEDLGAVPVLGAMLGTDKGKVPLRGRFSMRFLAMGDDASNGTMSLAEDGQVLVKWDGRDSLPLYDAIRASLREMTQQLNGTYVDPPNYDPETGNGLLTAHPLGGCSMADDARHGVVDPKGRVYGVPGLYVADGAIVPSALGKNPSFTISALAERVAYWMLHDREATEADVASVPQT